MGRYGDWIETYTGVHFYPLDPANGGMDPFLRARNALGDYVYVLWANKRIDPHQITLRPKKVRQGQ